MSRVEWCVTAITFLLAVGAGVYGEEMIEDGEQENEMMIVIKFVLGCFCWFYLITICCKT